MDPCNNDPEQCHTQVYYQVTDFHYNPNQAQVYYHVVAPINHPPPPNKWKLYNLARYIIACIIQFTMGVGV